MLSCVPPWYPQIPLTILCTTAFPCVFTSRSQHLFAASLCQRAALRLLEPTLPKGMEGGESVVVPGKVYVLSLSTLNNDWEWGGINKYSSSLGPWLGGCEVWLHSKPIYTIATFHSTLLDISHLFGLFSVPGPLPCCLVVFYWKYFLINHFHMNPQGLILKNPI